MIVPRKRKCVRKWHEHFAIAKINNKLDLFQINEKFASVINVYALWGVVYVCRRMQRQRGTFWAGGGR